MNTLEYTHKKVTDSATDSVNKKIKVSHLKTTKEFDIVFKNSVYFHKNFLTINAMKTSDFLYRISKLKSNQKKVIESSIFLGFSISKKMGKAVKRNLVKRRLKAIMQDIIKQKNLNNLTLIFVCRKEILELSYKDLSHHIDFALKKLSIMLHKKAKNSFN